MNNFEKQLQSITGGKLHSLHIKTLQVNLGARCNQECVHCHIMASPRRTEIMEWATMELVLEAARRAECQLVDLTGGAPELNPNFRRFVKSLRDDDYPVQIRTNLTALLEPGLEDLPQFFQKHRINLVASLPCYLENNVRAQRGEGVYEKSIEVLKRLNALGYGFEPHLPLNLIYNPGGPYLPPDQSALEEDYRRALSEKFGITFSRLLTISNMPIGRFKSRLRRDNKEQNYLMLLKSSFNPLTIEELMCRHQISIGWDGSLYDCDFNLALGYPIDHGAPDHIKSFDPCLLEKRRIVTNDYCFGCTAGCGSSCGGALV